MTVVFVAFKKGCISVVELKCRNTVVKDLLLEILHATGVLAGCQSSPSNREFCTSLFKLGGGGGGGRRGLLH